MKHIDITSKVKLSLGLGIVGLLILSLIIGYAEFSYWHKTETLQLDNAKISGTMVSVRVLAKGKLREMLFHDGTHVKAGDIIARMDVSVSQEEIQQLENAVKLAKDNYDKLKEGQIIKVPVQRQRTTTPAVTTVPSESRELIRLRERAKRLNELFALGTVSAAERDKATQDYENELKKSPPTSTSAAPIVEHYIEYTEKFIETPPQVLEGAEQAIKQAELSLNIARQESHETVITAPVSGIIYYEPKSEQEFEAGDSIAKIGDNAKLWIEAEVDEETFEKIPLGKLASYVINNKKFFGTVIDKIEPTAVEETLNEVNPPLAQNNSSDNSNELQPPQMPDNHSSPKPNNKFIIRISLPSDNDIVFKPNTQTSVRIVLKK